MILCMGFSRKLERGIPLQRGSDASFCEELEAHEEIIASRETKETLTVLLTLTTF